MENLQKILTLTGLLTVLIWGLNTGCSSNETEEFSVDFGYDYFPLEMGKFRIYALDSVVFDPGLQQTIVDSSFILVREVVADTFLDNTGQVNFRIERSERAAATEPWRNTETLVLSRDDSRAMFTEDNLRFIKMTFPLKVGNAWDGNAFFDPQVVTPVAGETIQMFKDWSYEVLSVTDRAEWDNQSFADVLTLQLADNENLIELRRGKEQYAMGIGLIYRELYILDTQCKVCCNGDFTSCEPLPWEEKAEKGFILRKRLIEFN